ncbi:MAG: hypothetical protein ACRD96_06860, partial [Bryobacteraceae bacterium]
PAIAGLEVYHEIPLDRRPIPDRAKIRLGGERVAPAELLARFLVDARVPFKATAGLHRAIRSAGGHGFLNVLVAAALADRGVEVVTAALEEDSPAAFRFDSTVVAWREHALGEADIAAMRRRLISFGSCSFDEPVEDLRALGLL